MPAALDPPPSPDDHALGRADAPYVLTMYADFECPFCQAAQSILARVKKRLGDDLLLVYRHFPIDARHPLARDAARAAEAAAAQGAFWEMHDALFDLRGELGRPLCSRRPRAWASIRPAWRRRAARVTGTPAFSAGSARVDKAFDAGSLVDALRGG